MPGRLVDVGDHIHFAFGSPSQDLKTPTISIAAREMWAVTSATKNIANSGTLKSAARTSGSDITVIMKLAPCKHSNDISEPYFAAVL